MEIMDFDIKRYKDRLERKIKRSKERIESYEENKENLSVHGHWSLGYFKGINSEAENLLDCINELPNIGRQYLGVFDVIGLECFYVKIKAVDRENADNKFIEYINKKGYSKEDGMMYVIPLFAELETI